MQSTMKDVILPPVPSEHQLLISSSLRDRAVGKTHSCVERVMRSVTCAGARHKDAPTLHKIYFKSESCHRES